MIEQIFTLICTCDTCGKRSEPFPSSSRLGLAPGWVEQNKWGPSWSTSLKRQYCSQECNLLEKHGLEKTGKGKES